MAERIEDFPARYSVFESAVEIADEVSLTFAAEGTARLAPVVEISVVSEAGSSWHGSFFGDDDGLCMLATTPDPLRLLVVAGGIGYLVPVNEPSAFSVTSLRPIRDVQCAVGQEILLLAGYSDLLALSADGSVRWTAKRLASDGFYEVRVTSLTVVVRGYSAPEGHDVETTVDLATGAIASRR